MDENVEKQEKRSKKEFKVIRSDKFHGYRFVVVDSDTGEVLDDAQGYGYKSAQGAYKAYAFKQKHPNPKKCKQDTKKKVRDFVAQHKDVFNQLDDVLFYALKDGENVSNKDIEKFLKDNGINEMPITISDLLKFW